MFGSLKEKLKSWVKKNEEEPEEETLEETPKEKPKKKTEKKTKKKATKKKTSKKATKKEEEPEIIEETPAEKETEELLAEEPEEEPEKEKKKGLFSKFKKTLTEEKYEELFEELEMILLQNNVAYSAVESIKKSLAEKLIGKNMKEVNLSEELRESIESILINPPNFIEEIKNSEKPYVILFAGINGSGKTTTIAKVVKYLQKNKITACLAAADTFRAAAIQQLEEHANKLGVPIIKKDYGADPASVGFDAIAYAKKHSINVVLIDTAGRMQNKDSLMREIEKIERVTKPQMKIFLGESTTGNDATEQAKAFDEAIGLTGIILSKTDVDEKGGTAISVSHVTGKPILFLGTGQEYDKLEIFNKEKLIEKLGL